MRERLEKSQKHVKKMVVQPIFLSRKFGSQPTSTVHSIFNLWQNSQRQKLFHADNISVVLSINPDEIFIERIWRVQPAQWSLQASIRSRFS